jgi:hypothetical protein
MGAVPRLVSSHPGNRSRKVTLRQERDGRDSRHLWAYLDEAGDLHIDGQDLAPATAVVSPSGEYEWFKTINASDLGRLTDALGGEPDGDLLDLLEARYSGPGSYELERILRDGDIPVATQVWTSGFGPDD